jgi:hypothetical protein
MGPSLVANGSGEQPRSSIEVGMPELCLLECTKNGSFRIFFSAAYHQSEPFKTKDDYITCALLLSHRYSWQFYDVFKYIYNYINIYRYIYLYRYTCIYIFPPPSCLNYSWQRHWPNTDMPQGMVPSADSWDFIRVFRSLVDPNLSLVLRFLRVHGVHIL